MEAGGLPDAEDGSNENTASITVRKTPSNCCEFSNISLSDGPGDVTLSHSGRESESEWRCLSSL
jgi:hypothetical protein